MLAATQRVLELFDNDEFKIFIVEGDHGYGKSTYANKIIAESYSVNGRKNWDTTQLFPRHLGFHPAQVLKIWMNKNKRDKVFHWDDAGMWLNALDYQDPFVKAVGKYLQVARTDWACIVFSCIHHDDIANKIRNLRHAITIEVIKNSTHKEPHKRLADADTYFKSRKGQIRWRNNWEENFNCHVPDQFYSWYNPLRKKYSKMAKKLMQDKLEKKKDLMQYAEDFLDQL